MIGVVLWREREREISIVMVISIAMVISICATWEGALLLTTDSSGSCL